MILGFAAAMAMATAAAYAAPANIKTIDTPLGKILADDKGMVLYIFDRDTKGAAESACKGNCIVQWPAFVAPADAKADGDWTVVNYTDKDNMPGKIWAYKGLPVYYWIKDTKPGDTTGAGVGGVWHVVKMQ
jgi:predicted lipoprotein with Yx(FWY)xxD motif